MAAVSKLKENGGEKECVCGGRGGRRGKQRAHRMHAGTPARDRQSFVTSIEGAAVFGQLSITRIIEFVG